MRLAGYENFKFSRQLFFLTGVLPISDHYYDPFSRNKIKNYKNQKRNISSIDFNIEFQLDFIKNFTYQNELKEFPYNKTEDKQFYYNNPNFVAGDAEFHYSLIRLVKPKNIIEIGAGFSTLIAIEAIKRNKDEDPNYDCNLICIEPYEFKWLKNEKVNFIKKIVENVEINLFQSLSHNDILFVDSSHIIKPEGDLLFIFMKILPVLNSGVYIHFHDIFSPADYPDFWIKDKILLWNEQYLLESFLSYNNDYKLICSLNHLKNDYWNSIINYFPVLSEHSEAEPGSFWILKK
jgi:predicted O-methyltransferase YrrM